MAGPGTFDLTVSGAGALSRSMRSVATRVLRGEHARVRVAITFLGKRQMRRLNAEHLRHDYPTDVITFPLKPPGGSVAADIYVCRYVAAQNARRHGVAVRDELRRLVIHGTLHALGWDHPRGTARTRSAMWRRQERYLRSTR